MSPTIVFHRWPSGGPGMTLSANLGALDAEKQPGTVNLGPCSVVVLSQ
jgi:hypothetical protein